MSLQPFSFPFPQTRFFEAGGYVYKFMIRGGSTYSGVEATGENCYNLQKELEGIVRTVLGNLENLQPFTSAHFNVFPYKKQWEGVSKVMCKHSEKKLKPYPFTLILYLEKIISKDSLTENRLDGRQGEEQPPCVYQPPFKRHRSDLPLEGAILKDLERDMEAESEVNVVSRLCDLLPLEDTEEDLQPQDKNSDVNAVTEAETPEEEDDEDDYEEDEEEEAVEADETPVKPVKSAFALARRLFPFSLFFRDT